MRRPPQEKWRPEAGIFVVINCVFNVVETRKHEQRLNYDERHSVSVGPTNGNA